MINNSFSITDEADPRVCDNQPLTLNTLKRACCNAKKKPSFITKQVGGPIYYRSAFRINDLVTINKFEVTGVVKKVIISNDPTEFEVHYKLAGQDLKDNFGLFDIERYHSFFNEENND